MIFVFGNPEIKSPKSIHLTMGFEKDFRENTKSGFVLSLSLFDKWMNNLVIRSSQFTQRNGNQTPENYNNEGHGRAYGIETQIKFTDILSQAFQSEFFITISMKDILGLNNFKL